MASGGDWDDDEEVFETNPHGYTLDPEEENHDEAEETAAVRESLAPAPEPVVAAPTCEAPPPPPAHATVVSLEAERARRAPASKLPAITGLASFRKDHPQFEVDPLLTNLRESALTDETIERARLTCLPVSQWRAYGFHSKPDLSVHPPRVRETYAGLLLPFFGPGAAEPEAFRLRPDFPIPIPRKRAGSKQRFKKYDQPRDTDVLVYVPPLPDCVAQLRAASVLYWTEGEKKALLIAQLGLCVVGLTGVDSWSEPKSRSTRLHPYILQHYAIAGREHVIVFDSDSLVKDEVLLALRKLAGMLRSLGASSVTMALPPLVFSNSTPSKVPICKGIDDYAFKHGVEAARELLLNTREDIDAVAPRVTEAPLERAQAFAELTRARDFVIPSPYSVDDAGAVWLHTGYEDDAKRVVTPRPIFVTRLFQDMHRNGEYRVELQFQTARGSWQAVTVPRALTGARALSPELRRAGALVDETSIAEVIKWLSAWEARNGSKLVPVRCVDRAGWCEQQFALGPELVFAPAGAEPVEFDMHYDQARLFTALGCKAADADVQACAHARALQAAADASADCALAIFAALTAPLLRPFSLPNFAVHLCGDSSRGKTSMLRCAASVFGDPTNPAWVPSWNTTISGLEQHAAQLCDLPLCFDEAGTGDPEAIQTAIYMLINGVGRQRSTKDLTMRRTLSWQTVVISTGERELASEASATGAQVRVISLPITGFGALDGAGVDRVREACAGHAGAFGTAWLRKVVEIAADEAQLLQARERLARHRAALREVALRSGNALNGRIADYFAAMMLAEDLASELGLGVRGGATVQAMFEARCGDADGDHGSAPSTLRERVLDVLEDWPHQAPASFPQITIEEESGERIANLANRLVVHGYVREDGALCFLPAALKAYLSAQQLPWTSALMRDLWATGRLVRELHAKQMTCRLRVNGRRLRVYILAGGEP